MLSKGLRYLENSKRIPIINLFFISVFNVLLVTAKKRRDVQVASSLRKNDNPDVTLHI